MFGLFIPNQWVGLLAGSSMIMLASILLAYRNIRHKEKQVDANALLMMQLSILSIFSVGIFVFFVFFR